MRRATSRSSTRCGSCDAASKRRSLTSHPCFYTLGGHGVALLAWRKLNPRPAPLPTLHAEIGRLHAVVGEQLARRCRSPRCGRSRPRSRGRRWRARRGRSARPAARSGRCACSPATTPRIWSTSIGASPIEGSSSSSSRGFAISARPIASICCWPPESVPAGGAAPRPASGTARRPARARRRDSSSRAGPGAEPQIVLDRERREHLPALGHLRDAERDARMARAARSIGRPSKQDAAGGDRLHAGDRAQQRGLAGAVGADQRDDLAGRDLERDAVQRLDAAVAAARGSQPTAWAASCAARRRDRPRSPPGWRAPRRPCLRPACGRGRAPGCGRRCSSPASCRARPARP